MKHTFKNSVIVALTLLALMFSAIGVAPAYAAATTFSVHFGDDANTCSGGCTLRGAITAANANPGADTIVFENFTYNILLTNGALPTITESLTIDAGTHPVTIDGNNASRIFNINSGVALTLKNMTITKGSAVTGAGIDNFGTLTLSGVSVTNNNSSSYGAGILSETGSTLVVINSTFSGNMAGIYGGAIHSGATATIKNSTFSGNSNGILVGGGSTLNLSNTIIANSTGSDCDNFGTIGTEKNNLIENAGSACGLTNGTNGDITGVDPTLGALAGNGGTTQTFALLTGSAAINKGDNTTCSTSPVSSIDQTGKDRFATGGGTCDIGAFEVSDTLHPNTQIDSGPASLTTDTTASIAFSASDNFSAPGNIKFTCNADVSPNFPNWYDCTSPQNFSGIPDGTHTIVMFGVDEVGNVEYPNMAVHTWTVDANPPSTNIDTKPSNPSSSANPTFEFSATDTVTTAPNFLFQCKLDGGVFEACNSGTKSYTSLANGSHTFTVNSQDQIGWVSANATYTWTINTGSGVPDATIDTRPTNPSNDNTPTFTFSATDDLTLPANIIFTCNLDGGGASTCTSPKTYSTQADGSHTFVVIATDEQAHNSPPVSYTWTIDTTAPDTSITIKTPNTSPTNSTSMAFNFSSPDGTATFECSKDSAAFTACSNPKTYTALTEGAHNFKVHAKDTAGNVDASPASYDWVVDTTAPDTSINSHPTDPSSSTSASFTFSSPDGTATFECNLEGNGWGACSSPKTYNGLGQGSHTFEVRAKDLAGNLDASPASFTWTIATDSIPPETSIDTKPTDPTTNKTATFTFSGTDNVTAPASLTFMCNSPDHIPAVYSCTSPQTLTGLAVGSHQFSVYAVDGAGNTDSLSPATYTWTVIAPFDRVKNGSFETYTGSSRVPASWVKSASWSTTDGKDKTVKKQGTTSVKFSGPASKIKTLTQTLALGGTAGDAFAFTYWVKGSGLPKAGTCQVQVLLYKGAALATTKTVKCPTTASFNWKKMTLNFTATSAYTKVVIKISFQKVSGTVWFDGVSLKR